MASESKLTVNSRSQALEFAAHDTPPQAAPESLDSSVHDSTERVRAVWAGTLWTGTLWTGTLRGPLLRGPLNRLVDIWDSRRTPALLISVIFHTTVLLLLALLTISAPLGASRSADFRLSGPVEAMDTTTELTLAAGDSPPPPSIEQSTRTEVSASSQTSSTLSLSKLLDIEAPPASTEPVTGTPDGLMQAAMLNLNASFSSTGVQGRSPEQRRQLAVTRGGTMTSEQAVENALEWIAEHQLPTGGWSLIHDGGRCKGRCKNNGARDRFEPAATGLALLAFLGAGYTHQEGKHRDVVRKGVYFLLQVMEETPEGGSFLYQCDRGMYNHGIASFALCEAYQLTGDKDLRKPAQQAVDFIAAAQHYRGGWGYLPKQPGDLTLSGWQIMALKSAFAAGLEVPASTILRIDPFLDSQQAESGIFYGYQQPGKNPTCTAIGQLVRLFRGMTHTDPRVLEAAAYFTKSGRSNGDAYFNYYATLFLFHVGGPLWENWNPNMREHLIATQSTSGHESGSWYFENPFGKEGGRLYTTAMCAMTLEVYYRFAPIYQQVDVTFVP